MVFPRDEFRLLIDVAGPPGEQVRSATHGPEYRTSDTGVQRDASGGRRERAPASGVAVSNPGNEHPGGDRKNEGNGRRDAGHVGPKDDCAGNVGEHGVCGEYGDCAEEEVHRAPAPWRARGGHGDRKEHQRQSEE